jgi:hypothetical protein
MKLTDELPVTSTSRQRNRVNSKGGSLIIHSSITGYMRPKETDSPWQRYSSKGSGRPLAVRDSRYLRLESSTSRVLAGIGMLT